MLTKRIIPCLDVTDGRVVKGIQYKDLQDAGDPVEQAAEYDRQGADELVFLDITASPNRRKTVVDMVSKVAEQVSIPFAVGGGIRSTEDMRLMLESGADKVGINTAAVENPRLIAEGAERFGSQCIVVNIDPKRIDRDGQEFWDVHVNGGRIPTGLQAVEWAQEVERLGAGEIVLTSMDADGTKDGYDIELTRAVSDAVNIPVIASGGCGTLEHIHEALTAGGASAALAASIFHYREYSVRETKDFLAERGVTVRL